MKKQILFSIIMLLFLQGCVQSQSKKIIDLSVNGTANCYIVSESGTYCFPTVKGNSSEFIKEISSTEVLWESFITTSAPVKGDLISNVKCEHERIVFQTAETFKKGNAIIAAKDKSGEILWSWHIWFTDQPQEQIYYNAAGTMMDRDLGAVSNEEQGLTYQWGRKDPFMGYEIVSTANQEWEMYDYEIATIKYAISHPTVIIATKASEYGYLNGGVWCRDKNPKLWDTSKTIYDPCPAGWQVPNKDIWYNANPSYQGDEDKQFAKEFGDYDSILYPRNHYWSTKPYRYTCLSTLGYEFADWCDDCDAIGDRAYIRCQKE